MADIERTILDHYQLSTAHPSEWPADKDNSDASDDEEEEEAPKPKQNGSMATTASRRKSKYFALERANDRRKSLIPGSQKTGDGVENLVQRDEPDPLGSTDSVVRILRQLGLPVQEDIGLRLCFYSSCKLR